LKRKCPKAVEPHPLLAKAIPAAQQLIRSENFSLENLCHALDCSLRELAEAVGSLDEMMAHVNGQFMAAFLEQAKALDAGIGDDAEAAVRLNQAWLDYALDHLQQMKVLLQYRWTPGFERPKWYMDLVAACFVPVETRLGKLAPQASPEAIKVAARGMYAQASGLYFLSMNERASPAGIASRQKVMELSTRWMIKGLQAG
jgi:hypothetical protein